MKSTFPGLLVTLLSASGVPAALGGDEPPLCGGRHGVRCQTGELCDAAPGSCGHVDPPGFCMPQPEACTAEYLPVCGCDGKTYSNDCARRAADVWKAKDGQC